tara:strand:- start:4041 stop:6236 length:2196 start_codon:yes stop_codon:yes gene_type:complete
MAPRRTTFESGTIGMIDIPSIEFGQFRGQANIFSDLETKLDAITSFAIERGAEDAQQRAATDFLQAFEQNPNYVDEFLKATSAEKEKILTSGDKTLYGSKTKQLGLDVIENALTTDAIASIKLNKEIAISDNDVQPEEFLQNLDVITEEMTNPLLAYPERYLSSRRLIKEQAQEAYVEFIKKRIERDAAIAAEGYIRESENIVVPIDFENDPYNKLEEYKNTITMQGFSINASPDQIKVAKENIESSFQINAQNISRSVASMTDISSKKYENRALLYRAITTRNRDGEFDKYIDSLTIGNNLYTEKDLTDLYKFRNMLQSFSNEDVSLLISDIVGKEFENNDAILENEKTRKETQITNAVDEYELLNQLSTKTIEEIQQNGYENVTELQNKIDESRNNILALPGGSKALNDADKEIRNAISRISTANIVEEIKYALPRFMGGSVDRINKLKQAQKDQGYISKANLNELGFNDLDLPPNLDRFTINSGDFTTLLSEADTEDKDDFLGYKQQIAAMVNNPTLTAALENYKYQPDDINFRMNFQNADEGKKAYELYNTLINQARILYKDNKLTPDVLKNMSYKVGNQSLNNNTLIEKTQISAFATKNRREYVPNAKNDKNVSADIIAALDTYEIPFVIRFDLIDNDRIARAYDLSNIVGSVNTLDEVRIAKETIRNLEYDIRILKDQKKSDVVIALGIESTSQMLDNLEQIKDNLTRHESFLMGYDMYTVGFDE